MQHRQAEHWLRPSVLEGAWLLLAEHRAVPSNAVDDQVRLLSATYTSGGFDFVGASELLNEFQGAAWEFKADFARAVFYEIMARSRPPVLVLLTRGREFFVQALPADAAQCFEMCGGLAPVPAVPVLRWLDSLASLARADADVSKLAMGRDAERRSLILEAERLTALGCSDIPVWIALDDNTAGYDIRSYLGAPGDSTHKLIEVKACGGALPAFHLSRNEILVARQEPSHYFIHLWQLRSGKMLEIPWREVEVFVPFETERSTIQDLVVSWPQW